MVLLGYKLGIYIQQYREYKVVVKMSKIIKEYTVWVGGGEITDYYLTLKEAKRIANNWIDDGYLDTVIKKVELSRQQ